MSSILSTALPSVVSSALASATPSGASCASADFTQFPTKDIACAVGGTSGSLASNVTDVFDKCCKDAPVESFNGECGYYCLSVKQSVSDLQNCFMKEGINPGSIFCNGNNSATATSEPTKKGSPTKSGSSTSGTAADGESESSAATVRRGVSKTGLGVLAMCVVSVFAGAML